MRLPVTAIYDACVLYPAPLRDLLIRVAQADLVRTFNLSDFPTRILAPHGVEAQHPDEFVTHLLDLAPDLVVAAAQRQRGSLKNPPKSVVEFLDILEQQRLVQTVARLRPFAELI